VILLNTPEVSRLGLQHVGGMSPAWAALEALIRNRSSELATLGVRAVCIRTTGMPETATIDLVYDLHAKAMNIDKSQFQAFLNAATHTKRPTTLQQLQDAAIFAASDRAGGMTGATINLTGGMVVDW
jgi:NAD(P)-dependent dehydrogenase (short-subunit alcohol dehydrogenase family)